MVIYDIETFPNVFTCAAISVDRDDMHVFEISDRRNDWYDFAAWITSLSRYGVPMVGYNNLHFDYPVIHAMFTGTVQPTAAGAYHMAQSIFSSKDGFQYSVWPDKRIVEQIDLFKIHHFDNVARSTSLKALQFAMRSPSVEDMPVEHGTILTPEQIDELISYNKHDVVETKRFLEHTQHMIEFRRSLNVTGDVVNFSDKKIGSQMLIDRLGDALCYDRSSGRRQPRQTKRQSINLGELILDTIHFDDPELNRVLTWLKSQTIRETKGVFEGLTATVKGFKLDFGTGGIHGSVKGKAYHADDQRAIIDVDVTSLYPSIAIVNNFAPAHLGSLFTTIYQDMKAQRLQYAKGTPENKALKLALNGAYGDSNNVWSPFYDPAYTMAITINGQLQLSMLYEMVSNIPSVEPIQINTDGLTVRLDRSDIPVFEAICKQWESTTRLDLESVRYKSMFVRDVNNYLAVYEDGKTKAKGAYETSKEWHQDASAMVVPKATERVLTAGLTPADAVALVTDPFDFMLRARGTRADQMYHGEDPLTQTVRYYIATEGKPLSIHRPPPKGYTPGDYKKAPGVDEKTYKALNVSGEWNEQIHTKARSVYDTRIQSIARGYMVELCNIATDFNWRNLDRSWYIKKVEDLVDMEVVQ